MTEEYIKNLAKDWEHDFENSDLVNIETIVKSVWKEAQKDLLLDLEKACDDFVEEKDFIEDWYNRKMEELNKQE